MNNVTLKRLLGGGSVVMVLILGAALFLAFHNLQEKEQQLIAKNKEIKKLEDEKKQADENLKKQADEKKQAEDKLKKQVDRLVKAEAEAMQVAEARFALTRNRNG